MTSAPARPAAQIYKKTYFGASHTWDTWNKLTASDVFALTEEPGFEGRAFATLLLCMHVGGC
jgi:hypothetical protein